MHFKIALVAFGPAPKITGKKFQGCATASKNQPTSRQHGCRGCHQLSFLVSWSKAIGCVPPKHLNWQSGAKQVHFVFFVSLKSCRRYMAIHQLFFFIHDFYTSNFMLTESLQFQAKLAHQTGDPKKRKVSLCTWKLWTRFHFLTESTVPP